MQQSPSWNLDHLVCTVMDANKVEGGSGRKYYFVADRWATPAL
jgi:hypothetical protein